MVLDVCAPLPSPTAALRAAVERTAAWAERARAAFLAQDRPELSQFGIVQGGTDVPLRIESAERTLAVGFDGYAIGGLSVGESRAAMLETLAATLPLLPADQPRYLMGLGDPIGIVESVALGVDLFDCVLPTRFARHGTILSSHGRYNLKRAENTTADAPAGRRLWVPRLRPVVAGLPAPPPGRRRAHRAEAPHAPQRVVDPCTWSQRCGRRSRRARWTGCVRESPRRMANLLRRPSDPLHGSAGPHPMRRKKLTPLIFIVLLAAVSLGPCWRPDTSPQLGLDLQGGVSVVLQPTEDASDEALVADDRDHPQPRRCPGGRRAGDHPPGRLGGGAAPGREEPAASAGGRGRHGGAALPARPPGARRLRRADRFHDDHDSRRRIDDDRR